METWVAVLITILITTIVNIIIGFFVVNYYINKKIEEIENIPSKLIEGSKIYDYLKEIGKYNIKDRVLVENFSSWLTNENIDILSNLTGAPTTQEIAKKYATQNGLDEEGSVILENILMYVVTRSRAKLFGESFSPEKEAIMLNTVQTAYLNNNDDLFNFLNDLQSMYSQSDNKEISNKLISFITYLSIQPTSAVAVRNALNYVGDNPQLSMITVINQFGNATNVDPKELHNIMINQILVSRQQENFSTLSREDLERIVKTTYITNNKSSLNLLKKIGRFYTNNNEPIGQDIMNFIKWLESNPSHQDILTDSLINPSSNLSSLIDKYASKSSNIKNKLNSALVYDLNRMRYGSRY